MPDTPPTHWKSITLSDLLTPAQLEEALTLYRTVPTHLFAHRCMDAIFTPLTMARINRRTEQENDPLFLSYALLHIFMQTPTRDEDPT